ncbi:hypothetical protein H5410_003775, partial [Solanum commersonii]
MKENEGSNSKRPIKDGKYANYHVQQGIRESKMNSSNTIELTITSLDKNQQESCKEVIKNERSKEYNESINEKEQDGSQWEEPFEAQQHQQPEDFNGGLEHTIITSNDSLPKDTDLIRKDNNTDSGSKVFIIDEKDQNYCRLKQGVPRSIKFRSIINIYKVFQTILKNGEPEVKKVKEEESLSQDFDRVLNDNGANCSSKLLTRDKNEENYRITQDIPRSLK